MSDPTPFRRRPTAVVRPYRREDREAVRDIFRAGGQRGDPVSNYIEEEDIPLALFVDYHLDHEPGCCFVAEAGGKVVGYVAGCLDNDRYNWVVLTRYIPRLLVRVLWRLFTLQYRKTSTFRVILWFMTRSWREIPEPPHGRYPAHIHIALVPEYRGLRLGRQLVDTAVDRIKSLGAVGAHGVVIEEAGHNAFAAVMAGTLLESRPCTLWAHCSDKKWMFRLLVRDLRDPSPT